MKRITLAAAATIVAFGLAAGPVFAQAPAKPERPGPRETAVISTMNDVMFLMNPKAREQVNGLLAKAKTALKAGNDAEYEASLESAMMILAKQLMSETQERSGG